MRGVELGEHCAINGKPIVTKFRGSQFSMGNHITLSSSERCNPLGMIQPCVIRTLSPTACLIIGDRVGISGSTICAACSVEIGEDTIMGSGAMILDTDFHIPGEGYSWLNGTEQTCQPINIGKGVFIGARAMILKGVTIGDRAVIGAGSVVTKDIPERSIVAGNPARIISKEWI
ncbi:acyltransferase [Verrucomicrobiaceae bacterium N1E253]|uniref:Acyltransferase n=2 Tax=Oceaniferula marina TaxID=2748318 RepID=A0A851GC62_9BACT|nr:acyltransferase [Oceaniferula marina]